MTRIKVCGITNIEDALACAELGADMLGFIFAESPRQVSVEQVSVILSALRCLPNTYQPKAVGVFVEEQHITESMEKCGLDLIQLHGSQSEAIAETIGAEKIIRVGRIKDQSSIDALKDHPAAAYYLLDTYKKGQPGGTGETFNWELATAAKSLGKPIILSGGLNPENVFDAIRAVRPFAVDVSSGVEQSPGKKDLKKVKEFIDHVREADNAS